MPMFKIIAPVLAVAVLVSGAAHAQGGAEMSIQFSGSMHAAAVRCGDYNDEQLAKMKVAHQAAATDAGVSLANFNNHFKIGYDKGIARFDAASPDEQKAGCDQASMLIKAP